MIAHRNNMLSSVLLLLVSFTSLAVFKANAMLEKTSVEDMDDAVHTNVKRKLLRKYYNFASGKSDDVKIDLLSIGSKSRPELIRAQKRIMSNHPSVAGSWWLTEDDDDDPSCSEGLDTIDYIAKCTNKKVDPWKGGPRYEVASIRAGNLHWDEERLAQDHYFPNNSSGWICAQKRVGFAIGKKIKAYSEMNYLPDFLVLLDDDTFINLDLFSANLKGKDPSIPHIYGGFTFPLQDFSFFWGGYSVIIPRASLQRLKTPLYCEKGKNYVDNFAERACAAIDKNVIGEKDVYKYGMSVGDLAYALSKRKYFCMHSDHFFGYLINHYHLSERGRGSLGSLYVYDGEISLHECTSTAHICHHMREENFTKMEAIVKKSRKNLGEK